MYGVTLVNILLVLNTKRKADIDQIKYLKQIDGWIVVAR